MVDIRTLDGRLFCIAVDLLVIYILLFYNRILFSMPMLLSHACVAIWDNLHGPNDGEYLRLAPAISALEMLLLAGIAYFGSEPTGCLSDDCSTTSKKPFYDLLG
jgi:hypothetical protein